MPELDFGLKFSHPDSSASNAMRESSIWSAYPRSLHDKIRQAFEAVSPAERENTAVRGMKNEWKKLKEIAQSGLPTWQLEQIQAYLRVKLRKMIHADDIIVCQKNDYEKVTGDKVPFTLGLLSPSGLAVVFKDELSEDLIQIVTFHELVHETGIRIVSYYLKFTDNRIEMRSFLQRIGLRETELLTTEPQPRFHYKNNVLEEGFVRALQEDFRQHYQIPDNEPPHTKVLGQLFLEVFESLNEIYNRFLKEPGIPPDQAERDFLSIVQEARESETGLTIIKASMRQAMEQLFPHIHFEDFWRITENVAAGYSDKEVNYAGHDLPKYRDFLRHLLDGKMKLAPLIREMHQLFDLVTL